MSASALSSVPASLSSGLSAQAPDALLALIGMYARDPHAEKIDLGVGVFRNDAGETPVMRAVKSAERAIWDVQQSKSYLGAEGDGRFVELLRPLIFGAAFDRAVAGVQTPGGTGALRLGAELIAAARPDASVWVGLPTWPNHVPIFQRAGLAVRTHPFFDAVSQTIQFDAMLSALEEAKPGDVVLIHGGSHNPTGAELDLDQWQSLIALMQRRGLIPFVDTAYQGLGNGLDADVAGLRLCAAQMPETLLAYSCNKNFGLYRERVGALFYAGADGAGAGLAFENMLVLARSNWSMPPDHGAAIVRTILDDPALTAAWRDELADMQQRLASLRQALAAEHELLAPVLSQTGMFALLNLSAAQVTQLRNDHAIYMAGSGRISIAGLTPDRIPRFAAAVVPMLVANA